MWEITAVLALPFLACLLMTAILGYLGLHVLKREVIFIDIAVAQLTEDGTLVDEKYRALLEEHDADTDE